MLGIIMTVVAGMKTSLKSNIGHPKGCGNNRA